MEAEASVKEGAERDYLGKVSISVLEALKGFLFEFLDRFSFVIDNEINLFIYFLSQAFNLGSTEEKYHTWQKALRFDILQVLEKSVKLLLA